MLTKSSNESGTDCTTVTSVACKPCHRKMTNYKHLTERVEFLCHSCDTEWIFKYIRQKEWIFNSYIGHNEWIFKSYIWHKEWIFTYIWHKVDFYVHLTESGFYVHLAQSGFLRTFNTKWIIHWKQRVDFEVFQIQILLQLTWWWFLLCLSSTFNWYWKGRGRMKNTPRSHDL